MKIWKNENLKKCKIGKMKIWKNANQEKWKFGKMEIRKKTDIGKKGNCEIGHQEK